MNVDVYADMTNEAYHDHEALSRSDGVCIIDAGPRTAKHKRDHKDDSYIPALVFGTMFHTAMEDLDEFRRKYKVEPQGDKRTKAFKEARTAMYAANPDVTLVSQAEYDAIQDMHSAIERHPQLWDCIGRDGIHELSLFGGCAGCRVKARPDYLCQSSRTIVDWKTTQDASLRGFTGSLWRYGYWLQPAWYKRLVDEAFDASYTFLFVAVEKSPPYNVAIYEVASEILSYGAQKMTEACASWAKAVSTDQWQAYPENVQTINAPQWVIEQNGVFK